MKSNCLVAFPSRESAYLEGGEQLAMIPRTSDGQLLFLLNNVAKMKKDTPLGSRIAGRRT